MKQEEKNCRFHGESKVLGGGYDRDLHMSSFILKNMMRKSSPTNCHTIPSLLETYFGNSGDPNARAKSCCSTCSFMKSTKTNCQPFVSGSRYHGSSLKLCPNRNGLWIAQGFSIICY